MDIALKVVENGSQGVVMACYAVSLCILVLYHGIQGVVSGGLH